jgi:hypothetical protein
MKTFAHRRQIATQISDPLMGAGRRIKAHHGLEWSAEPLRVERQAKARNDAALLHPAHALGNRRGRQAYGAPERPPRHSRIALERDEQTPAHGIDHI